MRFMASTEISSFSVIRHCDKHFIFQAVLCQASGRVISDIVVEFCWQRLTA